MGRRDGGTELNVPIDTLFSTQPPSLCVRCVRLGALGRRRLAGGGRAFWGLVLG